MSARATWERYAACWSTPAEVRAEQLATCVAADVAYRDPANAAAGASGLSAYMDGFRAAFPGDRFVIDRVEEHHGRSLAHWRQVASDGQVRMHGVSFAAHADHGRLADVTGFFLDVPDNQEPAE